MNNNTYLTRANMNVAAATEETKAIAEIQAKMILARKIPRDPQYCLDLIKLECAEKDLAEKAIYEYTRGTTVIKAPSIRLVECVARHWGNLMSGVKELDIVGNKATVKSFCWDLQTNFSDEKEFTVELVKVTKNGTYELTDPRDRYEMIANMGARRKRSCMQAVIPKNIIDAAMAECEATLSKELNENAIDDTKKQMLEAFKAFAEWISEEHLAGVCGKEYDKLGKRDIVKLRNLYNAIKDGFVKPESAFGKEIEPEKPSAEEQDSLSRLNDMIGGAGDAADTDQ